MLLAELATTALPLDLTIDREGAGGITGLTPTVALRNAVTSNSYLDWADNTFKTSGWTTKYAAMSEVERGHYRRAFNVTLVGSLSAGSVLAAEYHINNGSDVVGDDEELLLLVDSLNDLPSAVWGEALPSGYAAGTAGERLATTDDRVDVAVSTRATAGQGLTSGQATMLSDINSRVDVEVSTRATPGQGLTSGQATALAGVDSRVDVAVSTRAAEGEGLTPTQTNMLLEMYNLLGLDPTKPLVVTAVTRKVPADGSHISQSITDVAGVVTVQRQ